MRDSPGVDAVAVAAVPEPGEEPVAVEQPVAAGAPVLVGVPVLVEAAVLVEVVEDFAAALRPADSLEADAHDQVAAGWQALAVDLVAVLALVAALVVVPDSVESAVGPEESVVDQYPEVV